MRNIIFLNFILEKQNDTKAISFKTRYILTADYIYISYPITIQQVIFTTTHYDDDMTLK